MKRHSNAELDRILDNVAARVREEEIEPNVLSATAARVWAQVSAAVESAPPAATETVAPVVRAGAVEHIRNCADFQTLIPSYLSGELSPARALLFEDHTQECIPCRKALKVARTGGVATAVRAARPKAKQFASWQATPAWRWSIAAALILCVGVTALVFVNRFTGGTAVAATINTADGAVYLVSETDSQPLAAGAQLKKGERLRTAKDSAAVVKLADNSLVEMRERSEIYVTENSGGTTIHLERGNVIVQAAKQRERHLYVATPESLVSVTGTIFSVNSGTKGARVSVVEGEVRVKHANREQVLHPGDQTTTSQSIEPVPVRQEIAWSRDAERYAKLLTELTALGKELDSRVPRPGVRYSTRFLDMSPEGTVLYAALPNLSQTLSESHRIMQERIRQNPALSQWWKENQHGPHGPELDRVIGQVREFGEYLGEEIVVSAGLNQRGEPGDFLVLGELKNATGFRPYVEQQRAKIAAEGKGAPALIVVDDLATIMAAAATPATAAATVDGKAQGALYVWIREDFFAASPQPEQLRQLSATLSAPGTNRFIGTPFHARIGEVYREGAGLFVAADLEKIVARVASEEAKKSEGKLEAFRQLGLLNLKHFVVEQKDVQAKTQSRAALTFNEARRGIASWLAAPGPMGSLEYVSPDANVAAAFVVKEPALLVDDLLSFMEQAAPDARRHLRELETQYGLDVRRDFAAPLGGEFAFAVDGPIVPTPSWKMIVEVYDQARLQQTFERVVAELNKHAAKSNLKGLVWEREDVGNGRVFYTLKSADFGMAVHYAYDSGYFIGAPSRALIERAIEYRQTGITLARAPRFTAQLPADGNANFSAVFYQNLAPLFAPLADRVASKLPEQEREAFKAAGANAVPTRLRLCTRRPHHRRR